MPTIDDLISVLQRYGLKKVLSVGFGIFALIVLNCFKSDPTVDIIGNIVLVVFTLAALAIPNKQ